MQSANPKSAKIIPERDKATEIHKKAIMCFLIVKYLEKYFILIIRRKIEKVNQKVGISANIPTF